MLRKCARLSGVSRATSTRRRRSLSITSAARVSRLSAKPFATPASVFIEHGAITMPSVRNDSLATAAPISRTLCTTSATASRSPRVKPSSCAAVTAPDDDTMRCVSCVPSRRNAASKRTPITAPLAPEMPTTMRFFRSAMIARHISVERAVVSGDECVQVDRVLPRYAHAREHMLGIHDGARRIETHLRADALQMRRRIVGLTHRRRWIERRTLRACYHDEVAISLEARRDRPFDFGRIVHIHIGIDDDDLLDVVMRAERAQDDVLRFAFALFVELHPQVIAAHAAHRQMHVLHGGMAALKMREQRGFARNRAEQQMLHFGGHDRMKDGIAPMRDGRHFDDFACFLRAVVLRKFAERTFRLAHV